MEFENEFTVPAAPDAAWDALMDMDRVAACMPGATLMESHDDRLVGRLQVKVGPIKMSYRGSARFLEKDQSAGRVVVTAKGREERGAGTAGMKVTASLTPTDSGETKVRVRTDLDVSGKPAQFGRGVMAEVGTAIVAEFAERLAQDLRYGDRAPSEPSAPEPERRSTSDHDGQRPSARADDSDVLDLGDVARGPLARRAGIALAAGAGILGILLLLRRTSRPAVTIVYLAVPEQRAESIGYRPVY